MGDYDGNCSNVNVKGTNECCNAGTKDTNGGSENQRCSVHTCMLKC